MIEVWPHGDLESFEHAYRAEGPYVATVLGRLAVPTEAVGDAVQDVFVAAYRKWDDFDRSRPLRPWLTGFARHVAFRYRRSAARRARKGLALVHVHPDREPGLGDRVVARDFLQRFLAEQSPGHRRVFIMAEVEGRTATEIAAALGVNAEAVYGRLRSTRRRLKMALLTDADAPGRRAAALVPPWAILLPRLSDAAGASVAVASAGAVKIFAVTVGLGMLVMVGGAVATRDQPDHGPTTTPDRRVMHDEVSAQGRPSSNSADLVAAAAPDPTLAVSSPQMRVGDPDDHARRSEASGVANTFGRAKAVPSSSPPAEPVDDSDLAQETALLRAARNALQRGAPADALTRLAEHRQRFPNGQLADARTRARIRALCDLGRHAQARGEASALARARPSDPLAREALSICQLGVIQNPGSPEKPG